MDDFYDRLSSFADFHRLGESYSYSLISSAFLVNDMHVQNLICFGIHESPHALMTCLFENLQPGGHNHFIDGGDGGYAIAAKHLKDQLAKLNA